MGGLLLFNQVFEDADIFGLWDLDSESAFRVVTENEAVERNKLG